MRRLIVFLLLAYMACSVSTVFAQACNCGVGGVSPLDLDFGQVEVGSTSKKLEFEIHSVCRLFGLTVSRITSENSNFKIVSSPSLPFCVPVLTKLPIGIQFTPQNEGKTISRIKVETRGGTFFVNVNGTGFNAEAKLKVTPDLLDFGEVESSKTVQKSFTIRNEGSAAATITKISSSDKAFSITTPSFPKTVSAGSSLNVTVAFTPQKPGNYKETLSIFTDTAVIATISVFGSSTANPEISISPQNLAYGNMDVGTFKTQTLTINNSGDGDLSVVLPFDPFLTSNPGGSFRVKAKSKVSVAMKLIADKKGSINRTFTILSNDPDEKKVPFTVTANGIQGLLGSVNKSVQSKINTNVNKTSAAQFVDFDNDGKEDLYLTGFDGNVMFKNSGGGIFTNSTSKNKLANKGNDARGATWADVDNDGDLDVFIANFRVPSVILKNNKGVFSEQNQALGIFANEIGPKSQGGIFLDFNNDGRMDLFVIRDGAANALFKNIGGFQFANIASSAGIAYKGPGRSAVSADFNNDGFVDIYLVNFQRPNKMYFNNGNETFKDVTTSAQVGFAGASEQVVAVDFDNDEDIDLFVVNNNGPCLLYQNLGNGKFQNVASAAGLAGSKRGRSATFSDFDHDGDYDLILVQADGENLLFANNHGKFNRVTNVDFSNSNNPNSTTTGDVDNDGNVDIGIGDGDGGSDSGDSIYVNSGGGNNNWLTISLQGTTSNRSAIGAKVIVRTGNILQAGVVTAGNGKNQDSLPLEFGLGPANSADIIVIWPGGKQQGLPGVSPVNRKITIPEAQ